MAVWAHHLSSFICRIAQTSIWMLNLPSLLTLEELYCTLPSTCKCSQPCTFSLELLQRNSSQWVLGERWSRNDLLRPKCLLSQSYPVASEHLMSPMAIIMISQPHVCGSNNCKGSAECAGWRHSQLPLFLYAQANIDLNFLYFSARRPT